MTWDCGHPHSSDRKYQKCRAKTTRRRINRKIGFEHGRSTGGDRPQFPAQVEAAYIGWVNGVITRVWWFG